jgi:general secretion pathway protein L
MSHILFYDPESGAATYKPEGAALQTDTLTHLHAPPEAVTVLLGTVILAQVEIPVRQRQKILQAVPYALEESLCEDVDAFHFVVGQRRADGHVAVAFIRHKTLRRVFEELRLGGWNIERIVPDILAVPRTDSGWGMLILGQRVLVRTGAQQGFAVESESFNDWLPLALAEYGIPPRLDIYGMIDDACLKHFPDTDVEVHAHIDFAPLSLITLDLRQGEYAPHTLNIQLWQPWRLSVLLLCLWLLLQGGLLFAEVKHLQQQRDTLNQQMITRYRDVFPQARNIVNPRLQMEQHLATWHKQQQHVDDPFWGYFLSIAEALSRFQGKALQRLDYRNGSFELSLALPDLNSLDQFKQHLALQGLSVEIRAAESQSHKVDAQVRISPL